MCDNPVMKDIKPEKAITEQPELEDYFCLSPAEKGYWSAVKSEIAGPPLRIPAYYAGLMDKEDFFDPLRLQAVPRAEEFRVSSGELDDPLGEERYSPLPGVVHRYKDRVLVITTSVCAMYCRHCFRRRIFANGPVFGGEQLRGLCDYLEKHGEVREVILSGGDPFTLGPEKLKGILTEIRRVRSDCLIRVAGRAPVVDPDLITAELADVCGTFFPLWVITQFNHVREITPASSAAVDRFRLRGIPVMNQTVLLKGINDSAPALTELFRKLLRAGVKPYYLFQGDLARGTSHFRVSLLRGLELYEELKTDLSGLALPRYALDLPGGGGKVALCESPIRGVTENSILLENFRGEVFAYPREGEEE